MQGMWWLPTAGDTDALPPLVGAGASLAGGDDLEVGGSGGRGLRPGLGDEGGQLLRLAAAQRMSTEARRAVFCVVLGSQDCADALERLLRLPLKARALVARIRCCWPTVARACEVLATCCACGPKTSQEC